MTSQAVSGDATADAIDADFDQHDPSFGQRIFAVLDRSRIAQGIGRSEQYGGFWVITRHEDVCAAAHAHDLFSNRQGVVFPTLPSIETKTQIPITLDPPANIPYRRILGPVFGPAAVERRAQDIRDIANYLIDQFIEDGSVDFTHQLAIPLAAIVTLRLLGMDANQWPRYAEVSHWIWEHGWIPSLPPEQREPLVAKLAESYMWVFATISDRINEVRTNPVRDSLIDHLVRADIDGKPLPHTDITHIVHNVYEAGLDTTAAAVTSMAVRLSEDPQLRARLVQKPYKVAAFVEESLRIQSPVVMLRREVTRDCHFAGHDMKEGDTVLLSWMAANRDPAAFADPASFDLDRKANRHIAFGLGAHRCLGSHIARVELRIVFEELLRRIPDFTINSELLTLNRDCAIVFGYYRVPATFTPGPKQSTATQADVLAARW